MSKKAILIGALCIPVVAAVCIAILSALGEDKKDEQTITTRSGLKYVDLKAGEGPEAKEGSVVKVIYTGLLEHGKQFDSNVGGEPYAVHVGQTSVILGWHEGLTGMKAGGKRKLIIPPDLAYGEKGRPPRIPGKATLIFEVEVREVK